MPEHQKVQTRSQNIQSIQDKRRTLQKVSTGAEEEMRKLQEEQKEERVVFLSNKVDKIKMADAEMAAELQSLQAEEERRGSNASQTGGCCIGGFVATIYRLGSELSRGCVPKVQRYGKWPRSRCQQEKKEEGIVKTNKSKTKPVSSWRCQRQAGATKALQRVVWSLIFLGFGVHLVNAQEQGSQVQQRMSQKDLYQVPQVEVPWMRKKTWQWETCERGEVEETLGKKNREKRNSQGKDPWTFDENSQGGDLGTLKTNSQGEDPRTFKEAVQRWRVQKKRKEKK